MNPFSCPACADECRCPERHSERVDSKERGTDGAVWFRCSCACGGTWTITALVEPAVAERIAP